MDKILLKKTGLGRSYKAILLMVFIAAFTLSCGKKGPLYIPKKSLQVEDQAAPADKVTPTKSIDAKDANAKSKQAK